MCKEFEQIDRPPRPYLLDTHGRFLPDETDVSSLAPALEQAVMDASGGEGASKLNFTRLNENIGQLSEVGEGRSRYIARNNN